MRRKTSRAEENARGGSEEKFEDEKGAEDKVMLIALVWEKERKVVMEEGD
jgi:hypothetical protein